MNSRLKYSLIIISILFVSGVFALVKLSPQREFNRIQASTSTASSIKGTSGPPTYKLFFENSGSMNGYVNGQTRLKNTLHQLLTNFENYSLANDVRLNFLNTIVIHRPGGITSFINSLNQQTFSSAGGNLGQTDMARIFRLVLENSSANDVSIMVSDCILSPGNVPNASEFLNNHRIQLSSFFSQKLNELEFNTMVLQLNTDFRGTYWDRRNNTTPINGQDRPYYIWVFGKDQYLRELKVVLEKTPLLQNDLAESHYFFLWDQSSWNYQILPNPKIGSFSISRSASRNSIQNARAETKGNLSGVFQFSIGIDFSDFPLGESYFTDPRNYSVNSNYSIEVVPSSNQKFTHILKLRTQNLRKETLEIKLLNQIPQWVEEVNLEDDSNILSPEQIGGTFGLKYLFLGAHEGYLTHRSYGDYFLNLRIQIN